MVNKKEFYVPVSNEEDRDRINRLQSTLQGRLNLLNIFESLINPRYNKLTLKNIGIDLKSEAQISNFMLQNNKYIEDSLIKSVLNYIDKNGTAKERLRVREYFKNK